MKLCLPWERCVLAIKRVLFNVIRQVSSSFFLFFPLLQIRHITRAPRPYRFRVDFIWMSQLGECFVVRWKVRRMGSVSVNLNARFLLSIIPQNKQDLYIEYLFKRFQWISEENKINYD